MSLPKMLVYASGGKKPGSGGSGFKGLVEASRDGGVLKGEIAVVVSNNEHGGVFTKAEDLKVTFRHSPKGRTAADHQRLVEEFKIDYTILSGWLGFLEGHDPRTTINIHPAINLREFGGRHFHGHHVHEAVWEAFLDGRITHTGVSMHFATRKYDDPNAVFFQRRVPIDRSYRNAEGLGTIVNVVERLLQPEITNRVIHGEISWDGEDPASITGAD